MRSRSRIRPIRLKSCDTNSWRPLYQRLRARSARSRYGSPTANVPTSHCVARSNRSSSSHLAQRSRGLDRRCRTMRPAEIRAKITAAATIIPTCACTSARTTVAPTPAKMMGPAQQRTSSMAATAGMTTSLLTMVTALQVGRRRFRIHCKAFDCIPSRSGITVDRDDRSAGVDEIVDIWGTFGIERRGPRIG